MNITGAEVRVPHTLWLLSNNFWITLQSTLNETPTVAKSSAEEQQTNIGLVDQHWSSFTPSQRLVQVN